MGKQKQDFCQMGHPLSDAYVKKNGTRACRLCAADRRRRAYHQKRQDHPEWDADRWKWRIKHRYNLTPEMYKELWDSQEARCALCEEPFGQAYIDHNHDTRRVRGLLCPSCNMGLGAFHESIEILERTIAYIKEDAECQN